MDSCSKKINRATLNTKDHTLIDAMKLGMKICSTSCVVDNMKTRRLLNNQIPYAVFFTKVMEHYRMDFTNEKFKILISTNKVSNALMSHMALIERNSHWFYKDEALVPKLLLKHLKLRRNLFPHLRPLCRGRLITSTISNSNKMRPKMSI